MSRTLETNAVGHAAEVTGPPGKRGRKAQPPNPDDGPVATFAHELWTLKRRAGDPSFATMCTRDGAAASRSSLAAATRGTALPTWETTWEFVRVLAVDRLGADPERTHREWQARWTAAGAAGEAAEADPVPAGAVAVPAVGAVVRRRRPLWPPRGPAGLACAVLLVIVVGVGLLAAASSEPQPGQSGAVHLDDASFEGDVTFPDGSAVAPGQTFTKVWQLRNSGSVRWEGRYLTRVNTTPCQAPDRVPIPDTDPGRSVRIEVPVTAGEAPAHCTIFWKMTDGTQRLLFPGKNPIFLDVVVRNQA